MSIIVVTMGNCCLFICYYVSWVSMHMPCGANMMVHAFQKLASHGYFRLNY